MRYNATFNMTYSFVDIKTHKIYHLQILIEELFESAMKNFQ